ncbi:hypothetical protein EXIGLDRAFT_833725 [Exidia glandulosa HHB12029]|uniref:Uncharacterized protein n=1 Tax=Exidia glandulosa HHB12029 TaxID=1314781 RepID=A0A165KI05_EXIGL|nr:hypothetical protein EXIGLDRAFT_833725 [Exidia glandulosa HHB12029]
MSLNIRCSRLIRTASLLALSVVLFLLLSWQYIVYTPDYAAFTAYDTRPVSSVTGHTPTDKLVLFRQVKGVGFNNQFQEIILLEHIARAAGRVYVYQDVSWQPRGKNGFAPLGVFSESLVTAPRRSEAQFWAECGDQVQNVTVLPEFDNKVYSSLVKTLREQPARCVHVTDWITRWSYLESDAALRLWPAFRTSVEQFRWSTPLIDAVDRVSEPLGLNRTEHVVAIHVRRGDFSYHCQDLARGRHRFNLWNRLPQLPDPLDVGVPYNATRAIERCYPSLDAIVRKLRDVRAAQTDLDMLYIMHDLSWSSPGTYIFIRQLRLAIQRENRAAGKAGRPLLFTRVVDTSQVKSALWWTESDLAVAVDLELARRARVFIGNGFSSFSSDVAMLRLADGKSEDSIRFW